jgi:hypothetical protein
VKPPDGLGLRTAPGERGHRGQCFTTRVCTKCFTTVLASASPHACARSASPQCWSVLHHTRCGAASTVVKHRVHTAQHFNTRSASPGETTQTIAGGGSAGGGGCFAAAAFWSALVKYCAAVTGTRAAGCAQYFTRADQNAAAAKQPPPPAELCRGHLAQPADRALPEPSFQVHRTPRRSETTASVKGCAVRTLLDSQPTAQSEPIRRLNDTP